MEKERAHCIAHHPENRTLACTSVYITHRNGTHTLHFIYINNHTTTAYLQTLVVQTLCMNNLYLKKTYFSLCTDPDQLDYVSVHKIFMWKMYGIHPPPIAPSRDDAILTTWQKLLGHFEETWEDNSQYAINSIYLLGTNKLGPSGVYAPAEPPKWPWYWILFSLSSLCISP